jgi:hypothetical protein
MSTTEATAARNKTRRLGLIERVLNGHDLAALPDFTSNPSVAGSVKVPETRSGA